MLGRAISTLRSAVRIDGRRIEYEREDWVLAPLEEAVTGSLTRSAPLSRPESVSSWGFLAYCTASPQCSIEHRNGTR